MKKKKLTRKKNMKTHFWAYINFINTMLNEVAPKGLVLDWTQIKQTSNTFKLERSNSDLIQTKVHSSKLNLDPLLELFSQVSHIEWESTKKKLTWEKNYMKTHCWALHGMWPPRTWFHAGLQLHPWKGNLVTIDVNRCLLEC